MFYGLVWIGVSRCYLLIYCTRSKVVMDDFLQYGSWKMMAHAKSVLTSLVTRSKLVLSLSFSRSCILSFSISLTNSSRSCSRSAAWSSRNCLVAFSCLSAASIWLAGPTDLRFDPRAGEGYDIESDSVKSNDGAKERKTGIRISYACLKAKWSKQTVRENAFTNKKLLLIIEIEYGSTSLKYSVMI